MYGEPAINGAGHGHRQVTLGRDTGKVRRQAAPLLERGNLRLQLLQAAPGGRPARAVVAIEPLAFRVPDHDENIPADAAAGGLHQPQCGVGGYRRIHGTAAGLEDIQCHLGCQGLRRGRHAVFAVDDTAGIGRPNGAPTATEFNWRGHTGLAVFAGAGAA